MKKIAFLLAAATLIACSDSENVAKVDDVLALEESSSSVDELSSSAGKSLLSSAESKALSSSAVQDGKSSVAAQSSATEKTSKSSSSGKPSSSDGKVLSSSSGATVLSSGTEKQTPSNLSYLDFLDEEMSSSFGCGGGVAGGAGAAGGAAGGVTGMGIGFSVDSSSLAIFPYTQIIKARTAKLVSNGVAAADAEKKAKEELIAALGLDTLFRENPLQERNARFTRSNVEHALNYFFS